MKIGLVGNIMLGRSFNKIFEDIDPEKDKSVIGKDLKEYLESYDFLGGNLETTITNHQIPWPAKTFNYKLDPKYINQIVYNLKPFDYMSLANNHILDYNYEGLRHTKNILTSIDILSAGAGGTLEEAQRPALYKNKKNDIFLFSAADHPDYWAAGRETIIKSQGLHYPYKDNEGIWYVDINKGDWGNVLEHIKKYRNEHKDEIFIFSIHWGSNWQDSIPSIQVQKFADDLLRNGVNIIHGHSPHHLQKVDIIHGGAVFYSLGDFIDDYQINNKYHSDIGGLGTVIMKNDQLFDLNLIPTQIKNINKNNIIDYEVDFLNDKDLLNKIQEIVTY